MGGWCVDTAAEYAKVREQFGRPIGQFQAVKHRCADMLVAVEQARSVAWDAAAGRATAAAVGRIAGEASLAAAAAGGARARRGGRSVAKDCIQVLGGIGFTWEHDAHLYLRRAIAVRQLLGGAAPWRREVAGAALGRRPAALHLELPPEAEPFRAEVRAFADVRRRPATGPSSASGSSTAGWFVPHWPPPWGRDAGAVEQLVIDEEFRRRRIRRPNLAVGAWAAPTIVAHGTREQQERWVRPTLLGDDLRGASCSASRAPGPTWPR